MAVTEFQYRDMISKWKLDKIATISIQVEVPDLLIKPELDQILQGNGKIEPKRFEICVDPKL